MKKMIMFVIVSILLMIQPVDAASWKGFFRGVGKGALVVVKTVGMITMALAVAQTPTHVVRIKYGGEKYTREYYANGDYRVYQEPKHKYGKRTRVYDEKVIY